VHPFYRQLQYISKVSIEATTAIVMATIQTLEFEIAKKSGKTMIFLNSSKVLELVN
jgi:hypothetical protein